MRHDPERNACSLESHEHLELERLSSFDHMVACDGGDTCEMLLIKIFWHEHAHAVSVHVNFNC